MANYRKGYDPEEENRLLSIFEQVTADPYFGIGTTRDELLNAPDAAFDQFNPMSPSDYLDADMDAVGGAYDASPAPLTEIPTSSSNASKPRTVAAGYQQYVGQRGVAYADRRGKLTVMFRDGTLYNYYDVSPEEWQKFKGQLSKGPMLNWYPVPGFLLDGRDRGPADMSNVSDDVRRTIYRVARFAQVRFESKYRKPTASAGTRLYVPKRAAKRAQLSPKSRLSKGLGKNPNQK